MKYNIQEFEKRVDQGLLRKSEKDDLVLYVYSEKTAYDKLWDEYTSISRGLILNKNTGEVVAKCFEKFWNLFEVEQTYLQNLPNEPYECFEKMDGSLGIVFHYDGKWQVATKGSFYSEQAQKAQEMLSKYEIETWPEECTLLVEIIYPENRIVVDYAGEEKLVLLAVYNRETGEEFNYSNIKLTDSIIPSGFPLVPKLDHTIQEMIALQKTLPKDKEGFVVRFQNGLRVKIKGEEYCKIHKILSQLSPLAVWEVMENGKVPKSYLEQIPWELQDVLNPIVNTLEKQYLDIYLAIGREFWDLIPLLENSENKRKTIGLYSKENQDKLKYSNGFFPWFDKNEAGIAKFISKQIRPEGNVFVKLGE